MNTQETPDLFAFTNEAFNPFLTLSWRRSLSYRNPGHERIKECSLYIPPENIKNTSCFIEVFRRHRKGTLIWNGLKENFFFVLYSIAGGWMWQKRKNENSFRASTAVPRFVTACEKEEWWKYFQKMFDFFSSTHICMEVLIWIPLHL